LRIALLLRIACYADHESQHAVLRSDRPHTAH
jgi:hypothetical protein